MSTNKVWLILLSLVILATACADVDDTPGSNKDSRASNSSQSPYQPSPAEEWTVTETGIGPVRVGMSVAEAKRAWAGELTVLGETAPCYYLKSDKEPSGIWFMAIVGHIARVDVENPSVATSVGARVGDSEERIKTLYPGQVEVTPHKYTQGHYLTVTPAASAYRIIFETDGEKVTRYRAGRLPEVRWVEGCS